MKIDMYREKALIPETADKPQKPDPNEEGQEPERDPRVIISVEDFYDLLME